MDNMEVNSPRRIENYPNLDLAKFVCALLVIVIHTNPLQTVSKLSHFYLCDVLARVAVPVFFAISGFLFFRGISFKNGRIAKTAENRRRLIRTTWKNVRLYLCWSVAYLAIQLPEWYQSGWWGIHVVKDWIYSLVLIGSYYHLWFLLALIMAVPALYLLLRVVPMSRLPWIASVLWVLECLTYSYRWLGADQIHLVEFISNKMPILFDFAFRAIPLLSIGAVLSQKKYVHASTKALILSFVLCTVEASTLYFLSPNDGYFSYLFCTPFLACAALKVLVFGKQISSSRRCQGHLRNMSLLIYCLHPMICYLCDILEIPDGLLFGLAVTLLSVAVARLWSGIKGYLSSLKL